MVRNMLAVLSTLSLPLCPSRSAHFRALSFPFSSFRSLACVRPMTKHILVSRHSPVHNISDLSLIHKSGAANSIKTRHCGSHFCLSRTPSVSRKEHNFTFNGSPMKTLGFAMSNQRLPVIRASQHVTDLHGWTDPMQDAWAEVWTSPVVPPSETKVAEVLLPSLNSSFMPEAYMTWSFLPFFYTHLNKYSGYKSGKQRFCAFASQDMPYKICTDCEISKVTCQSLTAI